MANDEIQESELKVLHSNAGYYIGTTIYDADMKAEVPYRRETSYFKCRKLAELALNIYLDAIISELRDE